ncbi:unnamed protein product [Closterium sp. NIES-65]|nr:unnamed protein product [Closterium sp. NIES-65]
MELAAAVAALSLPTRLGPAPTACRPLPTSRVARYSSPATAALSRLMLPYLFPDLAAFPTVTDLVTHLRTSDTRYRRCCFLLSSGPLPLMFAPPTLTVDLLKERLLAAEKSIVAVGASRGDPRAPVFKGCSPSPLLPSVASAAAVDFVGTESVGDASAPSGRRRTGKGKGARALEGLAGAVEVAVEEAEGVGVVVGVVAGVGASVAAVEAEAAAAVAVGAEEEAVAAVAEVAAEEVELVGVALRSVAASVVGQRQQQQRACETPPPSSFVSGTQRISGSRVAVFDLDYDAILAAMYVVSTSDEGDCYLCVPPDPGIEAAALGASASAAQGAGKSALSGTTSAQALHTFTLDSGASHSFFQDRTPLTPLSRPVAVSLTDPSGGPVLAHFSTVLPCAAAPSGTLSV